MNCPLVTKIIDKDIIKIVTYSTENQNTRNSLNVLGPLVVGHRAISAKQKSRESSHDNLKINHRPFFYMAHVSSPLDCSA